MAQHQVPGGPFVNEVGTAQRQIPGWQFVSATPAGATTSEGALSAQAATLAGTANHVTVHASSGALTAQAAAVSGSASLAAGGTFGAVGALTSQAATVSGAASHYTLHTAAADLVAQAATLSGTAAHYTLHTATGSLIANSASASGAARNETTYVPLAVADVATGGWESWSTGRRKRSYDHLQPPSREQLAEQAQKQREALGILPKEAQKRVILTAKREARKSEPNLEALTSKATKVAETTGASRADVVNALKAVWDYQLNLIASRIPVDNIREAEIKQQIVKQSQEQEKARQEHLEKLYAADEELLRQDAEARQAAIDMIRKTQKALVALLEV